MSNKQAPDSQATAVDSAPSRPLKKRLLVWLKDSSTTELSILLLLTLPLTLPALRSFFTFDDLQNLYYYLQRPWTSVLSNLVVFTSLRRPLGALFYLPTYEVFGMNPLPLYVMGVALFYLNLVLLHRLVLRLTGSRATAVMAIAVAGLHPQLHSVLYNFGAVYELTCLTAILGLLHCHLSFLETGQARFRWGTIGFFLVGLNAKETAVVAPALLAAYEITYRFLWTKKRDSLTAISLRIAPLFAIAVPYTLVKTLGEEALWRDNPLYELQWDLTFYRNLAAYFTDLSYATVQFSPALMTATMVFLLSVAFILHNRHMLFGAAFALLTLAPVLALPRVWALFLYVPLAGVALYVASLTAQTANLATSRLLTPAARARVVSWSPFWGLAGALLLSLMLLRISLPGFAASREFNYFGKTFPWKAFAGQLYELHPTMEPGTVLGFENPPFDPQQVDRWCLNFLVWLKYRDPSMNVYRLPEEKEGFLADSEVAPAARLFVWEQGRLLERPIEDLVENVR